MCSYVAWPVDDIKRSSIKSIQLRLCCGTVESSSSGYYNYKNPGR